MTVKKKVTKKKITKKATKKASTKKVVRKSGPRKGEEMPDGYVFGRPTKYKKEYCALVVEKAKANEVITLADICVLLGIHHETLSIWASEKPEFSEAIKIANTYRMQYMERKGLNGMGQGKNFNAVPWLFMLKNMFPKHYSDRKEIELGNKENKGFKFAFDLSEEPKDD